MIDIPRIQPVQTPATITPEQDSERVQKSSRVSPISTDAESERQDRRHRQERRSARQLRKAQLELRQDQDRRQTRGISVDA